MKVLGFFALVVAALFFANSLVSAGLPQYYADAVSARFQLDDQALNLLILIFPAVYVPMQLVAGILFDRYGARSPMLTAAALAALGLAFSVGVSVPAIGAAGRTLHAIGAAFAFTGGLYIAARSFTKAHFAIYAGTVQGIGFAGLAWWYLSGSGMFAGTELQARYYIAAGGALVLALLLALFANTRPVRDAAGRPGLFMEILSEIGSVLIRPRLWLILIAAALSGVPLGLYGRVWMMDPPATAAVAAAEPAQVAALFAASFAIGSLLSGFLSDGIGRRRGTIVVFHLIAAAAFAALSFLASIPPVYLGALLVGGGFFAGASVLFYALGNDRAPPEHAGFFIALIHAAFVVGAAGSVYAAGRVAPLGEIVDLARYFAPLCLVGAAVVALVIPDKGPIEIAPRDVVTAPPPAGEEMPVEVADYEEPARTFAEEPAPAATPAAAATVASVARTPAEYPERAEPAVRDAPPPEAVEKPAAAATAEASPLEDKGIAVADAAGRTSADRQAEPATHLAPEIVEGAASTGREQADSARPAAVEAERWAEGTAEAETEPAAAEEAERSAEGTAEAVTEPAAAEEAERSAEGTAETETEPAAPEPAEREPEDAPQSAGQEEEPAGEPASDGDKSKA